MRLQPTLYAVMGAIALSATLPSSARAKTATTAVAASTPTPASLNTHARAYVSLEVQRATAWVGQAIPITIRAHFRGVDGVTLEGTPQLTSKDVFTHELSREPRQSTAVVDGEPTVVATWTGTITPSTTGPLAVTIELPVKLRYRESLPKVLTPDDSSDDPFASMDINPLDPSSVDRFFQHAFQQPFGRFMQESVGRAHEEEQTLKSSVVSLQVKPLPVADQPPSFTGAIGHFDLRASVTPSRVHALDPITLHVAVEGDGDLDRVELAGVSSSSDWKAYPTSGKVETVPPGKRARRKIFEQVVVPLHGGELTVPALSFVAFDPTSEKYVAQETQPITVIVEGSPVAAPASPPPTLATADSASTDLLASVPPIVAPNPGSLIESPRKVLLSVAPVLLLILAAGARRVWPAPNVERSLRRQLRRAARAKNSDAFFPTAQSLIQTHFASLWGVSPEDVTPDALRSRLGESADPLTTVLSTHDQLRFGRSAPGCLELPLLCSSIERCLRGGAS